MRRRSALVKSVPRVGIERPESEIEIRPSSDVVSADDDRLGHVNGVLVDRDDATTNILLERGHLFGRREVTVPIGAVARVETDSITLGLTKDEMRRLRALPVPQWTEHAEDTLHAA